MIKYLKGGVLSGFEPRRNQYFDLRDIKQKDFKIM